MTEVAEVRTGVLDHVGLHYVDSIDEAMNFKRWLGERRNVLGVDTETGGFSPHRNGLRLVQFGDLNHGWAIPWDRWGGVALEALRVYEEPYVLHNSKFDVNFLRHHGQLGKWPWQRTHDTMTMSHLTHPKMPHGLKPLSAMMVDQKAAQAQRILSDGMTNNKWTWETVPLTFTPYWVYAAMDPVLTCYIYEKLAPTALNAYKDVYELEIGTLACLHEMERRGARVDLEYCYRKRDQLDDYAMRARDYIRERWKVDNIGSTPQLLRAFSELGYEPTRTTPGGKPSLDKYQLQLFAFEGGAVGELATTVLNIRKAEKNTGPYFSNFIDMADPDARLHPTMWALGTRTARMSITDPALQTLPKKDGLVRTAFVPSDGNGLITCDMDQIEMRLMAHFSGDPGLVEAFRAVDTDGGDFFINLAIQIYGDPSISKKDARRQLTKNTAYGKAYGAGVQKMAETAGVPFDVMEPVVRSFDASFPGVKAFQRLVEQRGSQRQREEGEPFIITPYGRRMPADNDKVYTLVNYLIQCHAAEYFKRKIVELDSVGLGDYMILPVHDELVFDVPQEMIPEAKHLIETVMTDRTNYAVPITASADVLANNWGDKYREAGGAVVPNEESIFHGAKTVLVSDGANQKELQ